MLHKKKENENRIVIRVDGQFRYDGVLMLLRIGSGNNFFFFNRLVK